MVYDLRWSHQHVVDNVLRFAEHHLERNRLIII